MPPLLADFHRASRDAAQRLGITDFWRWWTAQLSGLVPTPLRNRLQRWGGHPAVLFDGDTAVVWELAPDDSGRYVEVARIPVGGEGAGPAGANAHPVQAEHTEP